MAITYETWSYQGLFFIVSLTTVYKRQNDNAAFASRKESLPNRSSIVLPETMAAYELTSLDFFRKEGLLLHLAETLKPAIKVFENHYIRRGHFPSMQLVVSVRLFPITETGKKLSLVFCHLIRPLKRTQIGILGLPVCKFIRKSLFGLFWTLFGTINTVIDNGIGSTPRP